MISVNEYFNSKVKSLGYTTTSGKSTVGVMEEGEYEFGTSTHETMIVIEGELITQLPGETEWKSFKAGASFEVAANVTFKVKSVGQSSYLCRYK
jgi:purine/pyrimidine-nucleoside phosphorylase